MSVRRPIRINRLCSSQVFRWSPSRDWNIGSGLSLLSAVALGILALAKLALLAAYFDRFSGWNAFLPLPDWSVLFGSAVVELAVMLTVLKKRREPLYAGVSLIWFSALIAIYRLGLWIYSPPTSCHCLGVIGLLAGSSGRNETAAALAIWVGLTVVALVLVRLGYRARRPRAGASPLMTRTLLAFCAASGLERGHAAVQLSGGLASEYYSREGTLLSRGVSNFRVVRDGPRWELVTEKPGSESLHISSDGRTTFTIISATNITPRMLARGATNLSTRMQVAIVDPWNAAVYTPAENIPWWFLVLSEDADTRLPALPTPWNVGRADPQAFFCTNSVRWANEEPFIVESAVFFYSSDKVLDSLSSPLLNLQSRPFVSQEDIKALATTLNMSATAAKAGEMSVLEWTNTAYGRYPLRFQCVVYDSPWDRLYSRERNAVEGSGNSGTPRVRIKYHGSITSVVETEQVACPTPLVKQTWVADNRFRDVSRRVERVEYGPVTNWIIDMRDVRAKAGAQLTLHVIPMPRESAEPWVRWALLTLLCITLLFPFLVMRLKKGTKAT